MAGVPIACDCAIGCVATTRFLRCARLLASSQPCSGRNDKKVEGACRQLKALVLTSYNHFEYTDVPDPTCGPEDVLVQVKACGICGSDVHGLDGSTGRRIPPVIMGHEAAGVIAAVGSQVTGFAVGERVTFDSTIYCGSCWYCRRGLVNLCDDRRVLGVSCGEYRRDGAFAEVVGVPQRTAYRLPEGVSFQDAALVEPLCVAVHAVNRTPLALNDTAVVVGCGVIGLLVVQAARLAGCGRIIAVDIQQEKLDLACEMGADVGLKADAQDVTARVQELTDGRGADITFEAVGSPSAFLSAVHSVRKGGALTLIGNLSPRVELPLQAAVTRQLSLYGSAASCGEYPACLDMIARGRIDLDALLSAVAPLSEGAAWFSRLHSREPGLMKVVLVP